MGTVYSTIKRKELAQSNVNGYKKVTLINEEGARDVLVHILVANAFLQKVIGKEYVDHINTIRSDNRVCNLRWVTPKENANNETTKQNRKKRKNMNTILQKRVEDVAEYYEQYYNVGEEHGYLYTHKGDIKEAVIYGATFALQNQWISVEEALPEENKLGDSDFVFVKTSIRFPFPACYSYKYETWKDINHVAIHGVTHWMPIPEVKGGEE